MSDPATPTTASVPPAAAAPTSLLGTPTPPAAPAADTKQVAPTAPAEGTKPAEGAPAGEKSAAPVALELKVPEGLGLDDAALGAFKGKASELGLDSAKAQGLLDFYASTQAAQVKAAMDTWSKTDQQWRETVKADPDIGGGNMQKSVALAQKAARAVGGQEVLDIIERAGLGSHPGLFKAFVLLGRTMSEDSVGGSSGGKAPATDDAHLRAMYPSMYPKE